MEKEEDKEDDDDGDDTCVTDTPLGSTCGALVMETKSFHGLTTDNSSPKGIDKLFLCKVTFIIVASFKAFVQLSRYSTNS